MNTGRGVDCGKTSQGTSKQSRRKQVRLFGFRDEPGKKAGTKATRPEADIRSDRAKKIRSNENRTKKQLTAIDGENPPRKRDLAKVDSASGSPEKKN